MTGLFQDISERMRLSQSPCTSLGLFPSTDLQTTLCRPQKFDKLICRRLYSEKEERLIGVEVMVDKLQQTDICFLICSRRSFSTRKFRYFSRCQVGTCHNARRKVKPTRPMPSKWKLMNAEQKEFFMHHMLIPDGIVKCCPACHKKITKKLDMVCDLSFPDSEWLPETLGGRDCLCR